MKQVKKNLLSTVIQQITLMLSGFLIPQFILSTYGSSIHGLVSTITNLLSYVALLSAGITTVAAQSLFSPLARGNQLGINSIYNAIRKTYFKISVYYSISIILLSIVVPFALKSDIGKIDISLVVIAMGITSIVDCFFAGALRALLQADKRLYVVSLSATVTVITRTIVQILLIKYKLSIALVQFTACMTPLINYVIFKVYINKNYPYLDKHVAPNMDALSQKNAGFIHQIAGVIVNNKDIVLLSITGSLSLTSIYAVYQLVFTALYSTILNVCSYSIVANFGHLIENGDKKLRNIYSLYEFWYFKLISIVYATTAAMLLPFVKLYTAHATVGIVYVDFKLAIAFLTIGVLNTSRIPCGMIINAAGHYKKTQTRAIAEAAINLTISLLLIQKLSIYGLLIGTVVSFLYRTTDIILYTHKRILNSTPWKSLLQVFEMIISIATVWVTYYALNISIDSWIEWVESAFICATISIVTVTIVAFVIERDKVKEHALHLRSLIKTGLATVNCTEKIR